MKHELFTTEPTKIEKENRDEIYSKWIKELEAHENHLDEVEAIEKWSEFPKHMTVGDFIKKLGEKDLTEEYIRWRFVN
jgi:hypothetical protein